MPFLFFVLGLGKISWLKNHSQQTKQNVTKLSDRFRVNWFTSIWQFGYVSTEIHLTNELKRTNSLRESDSVSFYIIQPTEKRRWSSLQNTRSRRRGWKKGTEPPTAPWAPQQKKCLPTAPVCVHGVCVFTAVWVHLGWDKCRAHIPSMV